MIPPIVRPSSPWARNSNIQTEHVIGGSKVNASQTDIVECTMRVSIWCAYFDGIIFLCRSERCAWHLNHSRFITSTGDIVSACVFPIPIVCLHSFVVSFGLEPKTRDLIFVFFPRAFVVLNFGQQTELRPIQLTKIIVICRWHTFGTTAILLLWWSGL